MIGLVEEGDIISIDIPQRKLELLVDEAEIERRKSGWAGPPDRGITGYLARYARMVTSGSQGAVFLEE